MAAMDSMYEISEIQQQPFNLTHEQIADEARKIAKAAEEAVKKAEELWREMGFNANLRLSSEN